MLQRLSLLKVQFAGGNNLCVYGDTVVGRQLWYRNLPLSQIEALLIQSSYERATADLLRAYPIFEDAGASTGYRSESALRALQSLDHSSFEFHPSAKGRLAAHQAQSFSIVTPFFKHINYLPKCARSVGRAAAWAKHRRGIDCEWIIVNDDPTISGQQIETMLPSEVRPITTVIDNEQNIGISGTLNRGIARAAKDWIVLLDCDDFLRFDALMVLRHYADLIPGASYITSTIADVDESGALLRFRSRRHKQSDVGAEGMFFGHLKAFRKRLFQSYGLHNDLYDGCQDYELALRVAQSEPILMIPEPIYFYRWHKHTQSVGSAIRQDYRSAQVIYDVLRFKGSKPCPVSTERRSDASTATLTACVIVDADNYGGLLRTLASLETYAISLDVRVGFLGTSVQFVRIGRLLTAGAVTRSLALEVLHIDDSIAVGANLASFADFLANSSDRPGGDVLVLLAGDEILPGFFDLAQLERLRTTASILLFPIIADRAPEKEPDLTDEVDFNMLRPLLMYRGHDAIEIVVRPMIAGNPSVQFFSTMIAGEMRKIRLDTLDQDLCEQVDLTSASFQKDVLFVRAPAPPAPAAPLKIGHRHRVGRLE